MTEPLQRYFRTHNNRHIRVVMLNPGARVNNELEVEADNIFWKNLDDRTPFLRLVYFLIPSIFVKRVKILASSFIHSRLWDLPPKMIQCATPKAFLQFGLAPNNFVCFGHPSVRYYERRLPNQVHDLSRFVDLTTYMQPFLHLLSLDLQIVRVGIDTDYLPEPITHLPIIDYSKMVRSEPDELWLYSNCKFFLSIAGNGGWWFAKKFGRPTLVVDGYQFIDGHQTTFQTQRTIWDEIGRRAMPFSEQIMLGETNSISKLANQSLQLVPNTPKLIIEAINEIDSFAECGHRYSNEEMALLRKWDALTIGLGLPKRQVTWTRPNIAFLKEHENLIR